MCTVLFTNLSKLKGYKSMFCDNKQIIVREDGLQISCPFGPNSHDSLLENEIFSGKSSID